MGCNNSKLDPEGESVPAKIRPLLRRRLEEIKRLRNANALKDTNLSKKKLLKDGVEEDDQSMPSSVQDINERSKSISSSSEGSVGSAKVAPEPVSDKTCKEFVEIMNKEKSTNQDNKDEEKREDNKVVEPLVALEEVMVIETEEGEEEAESEDERSISNVGDAFVCPGSPSFRVYCIESLNIDASKDDTTHKKSPSRDSVGIPESVNSSEYSVTKIKKKAKKGSKFRRVMPKGGKNLLNVKSCYYPPCSGNVNTSLLSTKAPA